MAPLQSVLHVQPNQGDAHKSSLVNKYSFSQVQPWSSRFAKDPLQAHHKKEFADMVKEDQKKFKAAHKL